MDELEDSVNISFSLEAPRVTLHEPVYLRCLIQNRKLEAIHFDLGHDRTANFTFVITMPDGSVVRSSHLAPEGAGRVGRIILAPGRQHEQRVLVNEWHDFDAVGRYAIVAELAGFMGRRVTSEKLTLTVGPRNAARLEQVCEALFDAARSPASAGEAMEAAHGLSFVRDPAAVQYLKGLLDCGGAVSLAAVRGLARIANQDAMDALRLVAQGGDRELAPLAQFLLSEINSRARR